MRVLRTLVLSALLAAAPLLLSAAVADSPSFKPGAKVTLVLDVRAPEKWHLNSALPLRVEFDAEDLKKLPVKLDKTTWDFSVVKDPPSQSFEVPVTLTSKAAEGTLSIPAELQCGMCIEDQCTIVKEDLEFKITVKKSAAGGSKNQAQAKGKLTRTVKLVAPF
ncbi:hypothetical protein IT575_11215 [bacterium]|nr:hypothetical protein [bacterium]